MDPAPTDHPSELLTAAGRRVVLSRAIGTDERGTLYAVDDELLVAVMVMERADQDLPHRVAAMRRLEPARWEGADDDHAYVAWPVEAVFDDDRRCVGYGIARFTQSPVAPLAAVLDPDIPVDGFGPLRWDTVITIVANLSLMVHWLHTSGIVVGDLQEQTIWVTPEGRTTIVSCESFGFPDPDTGEWRPPLAVRPQTSAPELFRVIDGRSVADARSDRFALAILVAEVLSGGDHPFRGTPRALPPERTARWAPADNIEHGYGLFIDPRVIDATPPTLAPELLPADVDQLLRYTFGPGRDQPDVRPDGETWFHALGNALDELVRCDDDADHWYPPTASSCPWCAAALAPPPPEPSPIEAAPAPDPHAPRPPVLGVVDPLAPGPAPAAAGVADPLTAAAADGQRPDEPLEPDPTPGAVDASLAPSGEPERLGLVDSTDPYGAPTQPARPRGAADRPAVPVVAPPTDPLPAEPVVAPPAQRPVMVPVDAILDYRPKRHRDRKPIFVGVAGLLVVALIAGILVFGRPSNDVPGELALADEPTTVPTTSAPAPTTAPDDGGGAVPTDSTPAGDEPDAPPPAAVPAYRLVAGGPTRIYDSRDVGVRLESGGVVTVPIVGLGGIPGTGVAGVFLNVVSTGSVGEGDLRVYAVGGTPGPLASRTVPGRIRSDLTTSTVGPSGAVEVRFNGTDPTAATDLIVEAVGWIPEGSPLVLTTGHRIHDALAAGEGIGQNDSLMLQVLGVDGVPETGVDAVLLNVVSVTPASDGAVRVYPAGAIAPTGVVARGVAGRTVADLVLTGVADDGTVAVLNSTEGVGLIIEVVGYLAKGSGVVAVAPEPIYDTADRSAPLGEGAVLDIPVLGAAGIPTEGVGSVLVSVTTSNPVSDASIQLVPGGTGSPTGISVGVIAGSPATELVPVAVGPDGMIRLYHYGAGTTVRLDIVGWAPGS